VPGLCGLPGTFSFQAMGNLPTADTYYLRQDNFLLFVAPLGSTTSYHNDACFYKRNPFFAGIPINPASYGASFESVTFPNHFIRHKDSRVTISIPPTDNSVDPTYNTDATWVVMPFVTQAYGWENAQTDYNHAHN